MTPLLFSAALSASLRAAVHLKLEVRLLLSLARADAAQTLQPAFSFKARGLALFARRARDAHGPAVHLVIASGGNAALAVASAAHALAVACTVYLPVGAAQATLDILRRFGADVIVAGRFYAEALHAAQLRAAAEPHAVLVPAYDHETLWEGHASIVAEIAAQLPSKPDAIFCSVGGGGLLGGLIHGCKQAGWDDVPLVALETIGSDCFFHSMALNAGRNAPLPPDVRPVYVPGHDLTLAHFDSFSSRASGSLGASQPAPGVVKMALSRPGKVVCASVPDEFSMHALAMFADDHKLLVELACATALTPAYKPAFFDRLVPPKASGATRTVVFIVCGGFKISLDDAAEYKRLAEEDRARGGFLVLFCSFVCCFLGQPFRSYSVQLVPNRSLVFGKFLDSSVGRRKQLVAVRDDMLPIPLWVTKVHQRSNRNEQIQRKLEDFEIGAAHGLRGKPVLARALTVRVWQHQAT